MVEVTPRGTRGRALPKLPPWLLNAANGISAFAYRRFGARMRVQGRPLLLLHTVGGRSGRPRQTVLGWFPDERPGSWIVTATAAGSPGHPAWFHNIARHPDRVSVEIGGNVVHVRPESLRGAEREAAWDKIVALAPGYAGYRTSTDREIPVVRLVADTRLSPSRVA